MAIFHDIRRPRLIGETIRSSDSALNVLLMVLLIAFALATWRFYITPMTDQTGAGLSTFGAPSTSLPTSPTPNPVP